MKRIVFSFPAAVITFVIGISSLVFLNAFIGWYFDVPTVESPVNFDERSGYSAGCTGSSAPTADDLVNEETKEIYTAILNLDLYKSKTIVLEEFTEKGGLYIDDVVNRRTVDGVDEATIENYELRNKTSTSLRELFADREDIVFFTEKDAKDFARNKSIEFEEQLTKRYPGAGRLITLSNVGFNRDHTEALVYVTYYCGSLCAGGYFITLHLAKGSWIVTSEQNVWVS